MTAPLIGPVAAPDLHVMTFNIRRRLRGLTWPPADRWAARRPRLEALLATERPTVVGVQEALPDQARSVRAALGAAYRAVGHGRLPGPRDEACPVFYDDDRLELLSWRQEALSDRPDVPGSTGWGAVFPRVLVHAVFRDRETSTSFAVVNTHLDVFSSRARVRSAERIRAIVARAQIPAIVLGDLNAPAGSRPWTTLLDGGILRDAWAVADRHDTPEWSTYGGYREPRAGRRIDGILVSAGIGVPRAAIHDRRHQDGWASDHLPVQAVIRIPTPKEST